MWVQKSAQVSGLGRTDVSVSPRPSGSIKKYQTSQGKPPTRAFCSPTRAIRSQHILVLAFVVDTHSPYGPGCQPFVTGVASRGDFLKMTLSGARPSITSLTPISCPLIRSPALIWCEHPHHPGCPSQAGSLLGLLPVLADHSGQAWGGPPSRQACPDTPSLPGSWTGQRTLGGPETLGMSRSLFRKYKLKL